MPEVNIQHLDKVYDNKVGLGINSEVTYIF